MTNHIERLKQIAAIHLNCSLDDNSSDYVPSDLIPGSYRWYAYYYSNMYKKDNDYVSVSDKLLYIQVSKLLLTKHLINWTRDFLIELDRDKETELKRCILKNIKDTKSFFELKVNIFLYRSLSEDWFYADPYTFKISTNLKKYTKMNEYTFSDDCDWWYPEHYENFDKVRQELHSKDNLSILEIGVFEGRSSVYILDNIMKGENCILHSIDPDIQIKGRHNLSTHSRAILHEDFSINILPKFLCEGKLFDFIYIDGDHNASGTLSDIVMSWRLLKVGGYLLIDDYEMKILNPWFYCSHEAFNDHPRLNFIHPSVAIDAFLSIYRGQYEFFANGYQIGVIKTVELYKFKGTTI